MDVLVRLPLVFVTDFMLANRACSDLFPGFQYVSSLLPMDPMHMLCIIGTLMVLTVDVKDMLRAYELAFSWIMYGQAFYAYLWLIGLDPENYVLELFLKFLIISIGAYAFKRYYEESELVTLMTALFLYCYLEENPTRMVNYLKYILLITLYLVVCSGEETEDDKNFELLLNYDSVVLQKTFQKFGLFWIIIAVAQPLTWFGSNEWNLWNGIFVDGMNTPARVCAMTALLLILTYNAFELFKKLGFGESESDAMANATSLTAHFFILVLNDRVWDLEPEKRAELVQIYFLTCLVLFLHACYEDFWLVLFVSNPEDDMYSQRMKKMKAWILCFPTFIISTYLYYFAWSTMEINARSLMLFSFNTALILQMIIQISFKVVNNFRWFFNNCDVVRCTRNVDVVLKCNYYFKALLVWLCAVWMTVFYAVRLLRITNAFYLAKDNLEEARLFYRKHTQPDNCIRSLPRASEGQLNANDDVCLVCHENMEIACVTPCSHYYHPQCLLKCLYENNKCPLCQTVLYEV